MFSSIKYLSKNTVTKSKRPDFELQSFVLSVQSFVNTAKVLLSQVFCTCGWYKMHAIAAIGNFRYRTKLDAGRWTLSSASKAVRVVGGRWTLDGDLFSRAGRWTLTSFESWTVRSDGGLLGGRWTLDGDLLKYGRWTVTS